MPAKNNAMRALDQRRIAYTAFNYDPEIHSGDGVAAILGVSPAQVFKTLVVLRDRGNPLLIVLPSDSELDLKQAAAAVGEKRVRMAAQKEAEALTGLQVGGISALALLGKNFSVYLDQRALDWPEMYVSAGQRGLNLRLRPADYLAVTGATVRSFTNSHAESV